MSNDCKAKAAISKRPSPVIPDLGPFQLLPGTWANKPGLPGRGWNMIALPFAAPPGGGPSDRPYRLLLNQFNEELKFQLVDKAVPNRGIDLSVPTNTDQVIVTIDYEQADGADRRRGLPGQRPRRSVGPARSITSRACS